jgi:inward rectifier potassium channel
MKKTKNNFLNFTIELKNMPADAWKDYYYFFVSMDWWKLLVYSLVIFLAINFIFAGLYYINLSGVNNAQTLWDCLYFSFQSFSTIGYGVLSPTSHAVNWLVALEAFIGIFYGALLTGIIFSKFSLPKTKVYFSKPILLTKHENKNVIMFRLANGRGNQLIDVNIHLSLLKNHLTPEGMPMRKFVEIKLDRSFTPFFALSMLVVHTIDEASPLYGMSHQDFIDNNIEFYVTVIGSDSVTGQPAHALNGYSVSDIVWGGKFVDVLDSKANNLRILDFSKFHLYTK